MNPTRKILIVDDERDIPEVFARVLESEGYRVTKAFSGRAGIECARSEEFDLILLDVQMPDLDGYEVIHELRKFAHLKYTPVIFLTGHSTSPDNIVAGYDAGGTEYWKKPLAADELEARVRSILKASDADRRLREMRESFTSMIVHDLKGPLSGIVGFAELLVEDKEKIDPQFVEMIDQIATAATLMIDIVTDFVEVTRFETDDAGLSRSECELLPIIQSALDHHERIIREKELVLEVQRISLPPVDTDPEGMHQVFNRLIDNATRFTPRGGKISISFQIHEKAISIILTDTGRGIAKDDVPMLFDKMRITFPHSRQAGSRSGLSLPICRGIVEAHGGNISVESHEGTGTEFCITLPLRAA